MTLFVGRQPILDRFQKTFGYELLFRDGTENAFGSTDADRASLNVIDTSRPYGYKADNRWQKGVY